MNKYKGFSKMWFLVLLLVAVVAGCASNPGETVGTAGPVGTTRPTVKSTVPATTTPIQTVLPDTAVTVTFDKDMASGTITAAGAFTVTGPGSALVQGTATPVTYDVASRTATFHPSAALAPGTYIATIKGTGPSAVKDSAIPANALAGNPALPLVANDYVWSFTTSLTAPVLRPTVTFTVPLTTNPIQTVLPGTAVTVTFDKDMASGSITAAGAFTVTGPGSALVQGTATPVTYDVASRTATFHPAAALAPGTYIATIKGTGPSAVTDSAIPANALAGNPALPLVANDYVWSFITSNIIVPPNASQLGSAATYGIMATLAITNTGAATKINGDVSLDPGTSNGLLPSQVTGTIHIGDAVSALAKIDLLAAYNHYTNLAPGITVPGGMDLGAFVNGGLPGFLPPGTYTSGSTMLVSTPIHLNGTATDVWVFQIGSSLTTTADVILGPGVKANNVFWVPVSDATIGVGSNFSGTIVAGRNATAKTGAVINGRILAGATNPGTIALDTNTVNVPAP